MIMSTYLSFIKCILLFFTGAFFACSSNNELDTESTDFKSSSLAVIDVSGKSTLPQQYKVDGRLSSSVAQTIGKSGVDVNYVPVEIGLRKLSIGSYQDSIRIEESNYYTVMVHDADSIQLVLDAPYASKHFNQGPQIRWNIVDEVSESYRIDIKSDTLLLKDVMSNRFTSTLINDHATLYLYKRGGDELLEKVTVPTQLNRKETVVFSKNLITASYSTNIVSQHVKP